MNWCRTRPRSFTGLGLWITTASLRPDGSCPVCPYLKGLVQEDGQYILERIWATVRTGGGAWLAGKSPKHAPYNRHLHPQLGLREWFSGCALHIRWSRLEQKWRPHIRLGLRIRPTGDTYEIAIERRSGSQKFRSPARYIMRTTRLQYNLHYKL